MTFSQKVDAQNSKDLPPETDDIQQQALNLKSRRGFSRRNFVFACGGAAALIALGGAAKTLSGEVLCRPPGGQDEEAFLGRCIKCQKCLQVCPTGVIVPAQLEKGLLNVYTPTLNFKLGWCDYCQESHDGVPQCVEVCPTEALALPYDATAETVIIGKAYIVKEWCLAWHLKNCRVCVDACPYEAIIFDDSGFPVVLYDKCNGCGLCENVCISMQSSRNVAHAKDRAITIKPTDVVDRLLAAESETRGQS